MLKKALVLLIIPTLLFAAKISQTYNLPLPEVRNQAIYLEGCQTAVVPFAPKIPSKSVSLKLPYGEVAVSYDVICEEPVEFKNAGYIAPFRPGGRRSAQPPKNYYTRTSSIYSENAFYPAEVKSPKYVTQYRYGHSILTASFRPVQYNPVTGQMRSYRKVTVVVETEKMKEEKPVLKFSPFIKSQLALEIDNPESLEGIAYTPIDKDDYDYALITTNKLKNAWNDFIAFNKRRGLKTKLKTVEDINASISSGSQAEKLKKYLKDEYEKNNITFVMLGGDDNFGPDRKPLADAVTHKSYSAAFKDYGTDPISDKDVAADMYYETLDGDELDDLEWEIYAARFPADNTTELNRMINKTIKYSEQPVTSAIKKVILAGEKAWPNINGGTCWGKDEMLLLKGTCTRWYTTKGFDNSFSFTELYEVDQNWSKNQLISAINSGVNFLNHVGHSNNFMIMKLYKQYNDPQKLNNNAFYIGYTTGCYCGCWDNRKIAYNASINTGHYNHSTQDCIAEEFTVGIDKGAVAFISNTRFGLGDNGRASQDGTDGSSIRCERYLYDGFFNKKMHHLAVAQAYSKWINKTAILNTDVNAKPYYGQMEYVAYQINVLGDPALSVWTETPKTLSGDHPKTIDANATKFSWDTKNPYTAVALLDKDDNVVCSQITGEDGKLEMSGPALTEYLPSHAGEKLKINVKAWNHKPYQGEVAISATNIVNANTHSFNNLVTINGITKMVQISLPTKDQATLSLYNSKGILIQSQKITSQKTQVSLQAISNGVYYLRLQSKHFQVGEKLVLSR